MPWLQRLLRLSLVLVTLLVAVAGVVVGSQWNASTVPILGTNGQPFPGSIASMEQVTLNGSQQLITIRGKNMHNRYCFTSTAVLVEAASPGRAWHLGRWRIILWW